MPGPVGNRHNERRRAVDDKFLHALGNAPQGGQCQFLLAAKDAFAQVGEVDAVSGRLPLLLALGRVFGMSWLWPHDWLAVAPSDHEQAFAAGRRAEVACLDHLPLNDIAHAFKQGHEAAPGPATLFRVWDQELIRYLHLFARGGDPVGGLSFLGRVRYLVESHNAAGGLVALGDQTAPLQDLFHVLKADHPGPLLSSPLEADPRQVADLALARLAAGCLGVVCAVRRHVEPAHGLVRHLR